MKKIYLLLFTFVSLYATAQTITIPDANLKARLLTTSPEDFVASTLSGEYFAIDSNSDGEIQVSEALAVESLHLSEPYEIVSLEGLENFSNLVILNTYNQPLSSVNLSGMNLFSFESQGVTGPVNVSNCQDLEYLTLGWQLTALDVSGCTALETLSIPNVEDLNFSGCTSLQTLTCSLNEYITSLDITQFPDLKTVSWNGNLSSFNASGHNSIETIGLGNTLIDDLNVSNCENLLSLTASSTSPYDVTVASCPLLTSLIFQSSLENLNITGCDSLIYLNISEYGVTSLQSLNISDCTLLEKVTVNFNQLNSATFTNLTALEEVYLSSNQLTTLDLTGCPSLQRLHADGNLLTELNVTGLPNLWRVAVSNNNLTNFDMTGCTSLTNAYCTNNNITNFNFESSELLSVLHLSGNEMTFLDLSHSPNLFTVYANDCLELSQINLKNGGDEFGYIEATNCPSLQYVCADEIDIEYFELYFENNSMEVTVDNTCSVEPVDDYNSITGIIHFDNNNNGCDTMDSVFADMKFSVQRDGEESFIFSNTEGNYIAYAVEGIETVVLTPEIDSDLFIITPASITETFTGVGNTITADFCITPNGVHPDLDVVLLPIFDARPGFDATYQLIVSNKGNQIQSGSVMLSFNDAVIDYTIASLAPTSTNIGNLTWDFTNLAPFNSIIIDLVFNVNTPQEEPSVNVGDMLPFTASITTTETDDTPTDNIYEFNQIVIGAIDPNDKQVAEGTAITPEQTGEYLHYLIRFQNTGTAEAINIRVKDVLADNLDWDTFQPISASHAYRATLTEGNIAEFFFDNIWLPAAEDNEPESHGFVSFKIKPVAGAVLGDTFENTAEIYFDFESAIITNTIVTTVEETAGIEELENSLFMLYPNPAKDMVYITPKQEIHIESVAIYNLLGQEIVNIENAGSADAVTVNVAELQAGHYLIEIRTEKGRSVQKLIKQ